MLTQSKLNSVLQRCVILLNMRHMPDGSFMLADVHEFFSKLKTIEKTTNIPAPDEIEVEAIDNYLYFEWFRVEPPSHLNTLKLCFDGTQKVRLIANYETLEIDIEQSLPLNEDFPELILTHLKQFKRPTKKKRYK